MKQIVEVCPHCGYEQTFEVEKGVCWTLCHDCGKLVHFCDECMYNHDDHCNPMDSTSYCHEHYIQEPIGFKEYV